MNSQTKLDPADQLFSIYVRLRDGECVRCNLPVRYNDNGCPITHQNSHFQVRRKEATRFDLDNCDTLCEDCHYYLGHHPAEHEAWQRERKGDDVIDALILKSNQYCKRNRDEAKKYWRQQLRLDYPHVKGY